MNGRNHLHHADCISGLAHLPAGGVELVFADPPFNIGYKYDVYEDRKHADEYLAWTKTWGDDGEEKEVTANKKWTISGP